MKYISTRGVAKEQNFAGAVLSGLATDGGLYVPKSMPKFSHDQIKAMAQMDYRALAFEIIKPFVDGEIPDTDLRQLIDTAYKSFRHSAVAPLVQLDHNLLVLELFHGPTLAFKDFALQLLGQLFDYLLARENKKVVILGATSGDTGSAAIEGCRHCDNVDIFILHPHERISEVQRRQMTTVMSDNVFNVAIEGNFDDCQNMVKASFADQSFLPQGRQLAAINSINWARIMAQIVYYFYSAVQLGAPERKISYAVPTGNFGDIYAGYVARSMGLPIEQLVIATNSNDILHRAISDNNYSLQPLQQTLSPSMDIMISSNFERMLFDLHDRDANKIAALMDKLKNDGAIALDSDALDTARQIFSSWRVDDNEVTRVINDTYQSSDYLLDPHTAIGLEAARQCRKDSEVPMVCLATAHPVKFPDAVTASGCGASPELPQSMQDLFEREERCAVLPNDLTGLQSHIQSELS